MKKAFFYKSIEASKKSFNKLLKTNDYQEVIFDDNQRRKLIELMMIEPSGSYLDLACGTGYVGFEIARMFPNAFVIGIDIADGIISDNEQKAKEENLANISFQYFDGIKFPFFKKSFDGIVCRYAWHHFPSITTTIAAFKKILKPGGRVVIADAIREEQDVYDFINKFQRIQKDGHVRMYTRGEIVSMFKSYGFIEAESFISGVTFFRDVSPQYILLLESTSADIKQRYCVVVDDNTVTLTFNILNIAFEYRPNKSLQPTAFSGR